MIYNFKQSVHIAGKDFPRGNHEVSEKYENDPHFLKYVGLGWITESSKSVTIQSDRERSDILLNRLVKKSDEKKVSTEKPVEPPTDSPVEPETEKPKGKQGKSR